MLARAHSAALQGVEALIVEVEVDVGRGLPGVNLVGLPETAVRESRDRVRSAVRSSGFEIKNRRTTINLAPADVRKAGTAYDLAIAMGTLAAHEELPPSRLRGIVMLGELALDGRVKPVPGALSVADAARAHGFRALWVPEENAAEAAIVHGIPVFAIRTLREAVSGLLANSLEPVEPTDPAALLGAGHPDDPDLADVVGQAHARRALEITAAGGHNLLFVGPPGSGKTLLARRLPSILPRLTLPEALEATRIHSVAGLLGDRPLVTRRPFRAPHHTISTAGLAGGGSWPRPGEISLAHRGVLFLDEIAEFHRGALEVLRQPLEEQRVVVSRVRGSTVFPSDFLMIAAMNPCPCGHHGSTVRACTCNDAEIHRYTRRISGPLLDRIDLTVEVPALPVEELASGRRGEPSAPVRERVERARAVQTHRNAGLPNARLSPRELERVARPDPAAERLLVTAVERLGLSARAWHRVLRVARTIADLRAASSVTSPDVAEAIQYRPTANAPQ